MFVNLCRSVRNQNYLLLLGIPWSDQVFSNVYKHIRRCQLMFHSNVEHIMMFLEARFITF